MVLVNLTDDSQRFDALNTTCDRIDYIFDQMWDMKTRLHREHVSEDSIVIPVIVMLGSCVALFFGRKIIRVVASFGVGCFLFWASYAFMRSSAEGVACTTLVVLPTLIAFAGAVLTGCVLKLALFALGALAFAGLVHLIFVSFPDLQTAGNQPHLAGRSFAYWGLTVSFGVLGGVLARYHKELLLEVMTSCIGGAGIAFSLHSINTTAFNRDVPNWIFFTSGLIAASLGFMVQKHSRQRGCKIGVRRKEPKDDLKV